jgi:hypothetical protein
MCAINIALNKSEIKGKEDKIFDEIYKQIPVSL